MKNKFGHALYILFILGLALSSLTAYPRTVLSSGGGTAPLTRSGPLIIPVDVGPTSLNPLPIAENGNVNDPAFRKQLMDTAKAVGWALKDQSIVTSEAIKTVSPSMNAQGRVIALSISGQSFIANGPVVWDNNRQTYLFKGSVTKFR